MTESTSSAGEQIARLHKLARKRRNDELETGFMAAVESKKVEIDDLMGVLEITTRHAKSSLPETLLWFMLTTCSESMTPEALLDVARKGTEIVTGGDTLREEVEGLFKRVYSEDSSVEGKLDLTIRNKSMTLSDAVKNMDRLLEFNPGSYLMDLRLAVPGKVVEFDDESKLLMVEVEGREKGFEISDLEDLDILGSDDFRCMAVFDPEKIEKLITDDQTELVRSVLKTHGPKLTFAKLKSHLTDVIPVRSWAKWWSKARPLVARCPFIDVGEGPQPMLFLRSKAVTFEDDIKRKFDQLGTVRERVEYINGALKELDRDKPEVKEVLNHCALWLHSHLSDNGKDALYAWIGLGRVVDSNEDLPKIPGGVEDCEERVCEVLTDNCDDRICKLLLAQAREALDTRWPELYTSWMPMVSTGVADELARELAKADENSMIMQAVEKTMLYPKRHVGALLWIWKSRNAKKFSEAIGHISRPDVLMHLLSLTESLDKPGISKEQRKQLASVRAAISVNNYKTSHEVIGECNAPQAIKMKTTTERNFKINEEMQSQVVSSVRIHHHKLFEEHIDPWKEKALYCTEDGLKGKQEEYVDIVNIKLVEIGKEIGKAAAFGDLSENAEYTAALEQRDRLNVQLKSVKDELAVAKLVTAEMLACSTVTVGSRVKTREISSQETVTYSFLGPWELDVDKNIYSYRAPFAQGFMGKSVGDIVVTGEGSDSCEREILEIGPSLDGEGSIL